MLCLKSNKKHQGLGCEGHLRARAKENTHEALGYYLCLKVPALILTTLVSEVSNGAHYM